MLVASLSEIDTSKECHAIKDSFAYIGDHELNLIPEMNNLARPIVMRLGMIGWGWDLYLVMGNLIQ